MDDEDEEVNLCPKPLWGHYTGEINRKINGERSGTKLGKVGLTGGRGLGLFFRTSRSAGQKKKKIYNNIF